MQREERHSRKACSFRRWLLAPVINEINCAKEEIICEIRKQGQPESDPAVAQATKSLAANTKSMDQGTGDLKAAIPPDPSKSS